MNMSWMDWLALFGHYAQLSLLSIGGAITTVPEMHRFLVVEQAWLTDIEFSTSIAIAQASPGPNVLFVAVLGWNVGLNAGGIGYGFLGVLLAMLGMLGPSTAVTYFAVRWALRNHTLPSVRAFKLGLAPVVVALLIASGWIIATSGSRSSGDWPLWLLTALSAIAVWRTRIHLLWLLAAGAAAGWFGWIHL